MNEQSKNVIKIDNFIIYEKNENSNSNHSQNHDHHDKPGKASFSSDPEMVKLQEILRNVEYSESSMKSAQKTCIMCNINVDYNSLLKFKNLEEFLYFLKYCYITKYKSFIDESSNAYTTNKDKFFEYLKSYEKYYKSGYIFKSIKYLCQGCFSDTLKTENGFHTLFNLLHISNNVLNSNVVKPKKIEKTVHSNPINVANNIKVESDSETQTYNNNYSEIDRNTYNIIIIKELLKKYPPKLEIELNLAPATTGNQSTQFKNLMEIMKSNVKNLNGMIKTTPPPSNLTNQNNSLQNKQGNFSLNILLGNNNLNIMNSQQATNPTGLEQQHNKISHGIGKLNEYLNKIDVTGEQVLPNQRQDERENSTINTNIETDKNDPDKKKEFGSSVYGILEDLKTQVASMHYYSMVQKYFINYIFKNIESFIEQVAPNNNIRQTLGEILDSNTSNLLNNPLLNPQGLDNPNQKNIAAEALNLIKKISGNNSTQNNNGGMMGGLPNLSNLTQPLSNLIPPNLNVPNIAGLPNLNILPNLPTNLLQMLGNNPSSGSSNNMFQVLSNLTNVQNLPDLSSLQSLMGQIGGLTNNSNPNPIQNNPNSNNSSQLNNQLNSFINNMMGNNTNQPSNNQNVNDGNKNLFSDFLNNINQGQMGTNNSNNNNLLQQTTNNQQQNNSNNTNSNSQNMNFLHQNNQHQQNKPKQNNPNFLLNNLIPQTSQQSQQGGLNSQQNNINQQNQQSHNPFNGMFGNNMMNPHQPQQPQHNNLEQLQKLFFSKPMNTQPNIGQGPMGGMNLLQSIHMPSMPNINGLSHLPNIGGNSGHNPHSQQMGNNMNFQELISGLRGNPLNGLMNNSQMNMQNMSNLGLGGNGFPMDNPFGMNAPAPGQSQNGSNMGNNPFFSQLSNYLNNQNNQNNNNK